MEMWKQVMQAADRLEPAHVAELIAIKWFALMPGRCPTMRKGHHEAADLLRWKLVTPSAVDGWNSRLWWLLNLTELGERVFLHIAEDALLATGMMVEPKDETDA